MLVFASEVLCHNPPLRGLPDHAHKSITTHNQWSTGA